MWSTDLQHAGQRRARVALHLLARLESEQVLGRVLHRLRDARHVLRDGEQRLVGRAQIRDDVRVLPLPITPDNCMFQLTRSAILATQREQASKFGL